MSVSQPVVSTIRKNFDSVFFPFWVCIWEKQRRLSCGIKDKIQ